MPSGGQYGNPANIAYELNCKQKYVIDKQCFMYNYFRIHQDYACSMLDTEKIQDFSKSLANYTSLNR